MSDHDSHGVSSRAFCGQCDQEVDVEAERDEAVARAATLEAKLDAMQARVRQMTAWLMDNRGERIPADFGDRLEAAFSSAVDRAKLRSEVFDLQKRVAQLEAMSQRALDTIGGLLHCQPSCGADECDVDHDTWHLVMDTLAAHNTSNAITSTQWLAERDARIAAEARAEALEWAAKLVDVMNQGEPYSPAQVTALVAILRDHALIEVTP